MVQNNKVLTVSYGTFSCTLEGFEDSFDTMKAIAEYFRDLAADDRYFGAEPPQPDADMLARIAQREISRQVEARADDEGIHLRAAEPAAAPAAAIPVAATAVAQPAPQAPVQEETPAAVQAEPVAAEPVAAEPVVAEPVEEPAQAEDLADDQAVTEAAQAVDQAAEPVLEAPETPAEPEAEEAAPAAEVEAEVEEVAEAVAPVAEEPVAEPVAAEPAPAPRSKDTPPAADSIAAKLQRIRDVVSRKAAAADEAEFTEDQHAEGFVAEAAREIDETLNGDEDNILAAVQSETQAEAQAETTVADAVGTGMSIEEAFALSAGDDAEEDISDALDKLELTADMALSDDSDELQDDVPATEEVADEDALDDALLSALSEAPEAGEPEVEAAEPPVVRVHKVKRSQLEDAFARGELEQIEDDDSAVDDSAEAAPESSLSAEDEADLMRELAAVEAELPGGELAQDVLADDDLADDDLTEDDLTEDDLAVEDLAEDEEDENLFAEDAAFDDGQDATDTGAADQPGEGRNPEARDSDISRLMDAAAAKLDDPESSSNRETFNQMRAAVAAAQAEREAGGTVGLHTDDEPYRADLASVVRPRRIRGPQLEEAGAASDGGEGGFAAFASRQGATELPELLEAAAAYLSFVEGREQFSRPQLMNKVRQLDSVTDFNREDGLRSFGQLLRDGKIEKAGSGRFTASGDIGFHPDSRAAG